MRAARLPHEKHPAGDQVPGVRQYGNHGPRPAERTAEREDDPGDQDMTLILWECNDCIPGCKLTAHNGLDDPPEGCPWGHNNPYDPNKCSWKAKQVIE